MLGKAWSWVLDRAQEYSRAELDICNPSDLDRLDCSSTIVNCLAYTDVDGAENNSVEAFQINAQAVERLAERCAEHGGKLIHFSSDYVFDGSQKVYAPAAFRAPINVYGSSKYAGEVAIQQSGCRHLIIRTSWLYAPWGKNFVNTIVELLKTKDEISVVDDQFGRPTLCRNLVRSSLELFDETGVWHITDGGSCSWFEFATVIVDLIGSDCKVKPCSTDEFPRPAKRPKYGVLCLDKTERRLGAMPHWREGLKEVLLCKSS